MILRQFVFTLFMLVWLPGWSMPVCQSTQSDPDGDGWGWENNASCVVGESRLSSRWPLCGNGSADATGWGWENGATCRVPTIAATVDTQPTTTPAPAQTPTCGATVVDSDADGWGYEFGRSCLMAGNASSQVGTQAGTQQVSPQQVSSQISAPAVTSASATPRGVTFSAGTLKRVGGRGDNWCQTWASDDSVITAMDDGEWLTSEYKYHSRLYRVAGSAENFNVSEIQNYPEFHTDGDGWFAYGLSSVNGVLYSLVTKTQTGAWSYGPFRGMKMLRSYDNGNSWYRVDKQNNDRYLDRWDANRELLNDDEMFFFEESGRHGKGKTAYPFSYASFVQSGRDNRDASDDYIYIYSPEGANSHELLLARAPAELVGQRSAWQYFAGWNGSTPTWSNNIERRQPNLLYPEHNSRGEYFGWYSWLPSVVWNQGLGLYVMVSGGTYAGYGLSQSSTDYYNKWMHEKSGSLGFWYSQNPYGPWTRFYYTDSWTADDNRNLTYQPKLSPKWTSADGRTMTLVWSDAMKNAEGYSHSVNYKWNQMEIELVVE